MSLFKSFGAPAATPAPAPAAPAAAPAAARPSFTGAPAAAAPSAGRPTNLFAGVPGAEVLSRNPWLAPGRYIVVINDVVTKQTRKLQWRVIIEATIIDVVAQEPNSQTVGTKISQAYSFEHDSFSRNVKAFICACMRLDPNDPSVQITQQDVEVACGSAADGSKSPLIGMVADVAARHVPTKTGGVFTQTDWKPGPTFAECAQAIASVPSLKTAWAPGLFEKLLAAEQNPSA